jgi:hypothetical protein
MIFITGDTHREQDIAKINPDDMFPLGKQLTADDYLIICGDFGCIWDGGKGDAFWLNWLESLPWQTCFIDGNHENFTLLKEYPVETWHGGKVHRIRSNIVHLMRGEYFDIDGHTFFTFGGGASHDVQYRVANVNWWQCELPTKEEMDHAIETLQAHNWKVDYVLTHDIYQSHPLTQRFVLDINNYDAPYFDIQMFLEKIAAKLDYKAWLHGHYHEDGYYIRDGKPTIVLFQKIITLDGIDILRNEWK